MTSNLIRAFNIAIWLLLALVVLFLVVFPLLMALLVNTGRMPLGSQNYLVHVQTVQMYLMRGLGVVWLFFLGGCFASFLNVVAWRVPRGRGINGSSMCPFCETKLKFMDNLPIIGWLRNGGRCRSCQVPISPRYLIVEIVLGAIFLLVCGVEILAGGANLPLRAIEELRGFEHIVFSPKWDLIQLTAYHLVLICLLFTFALIRSDRLRVPSSIFLIGFILGVGLPLIWPSMLLISWQIDTDQLVRPERFSQDQLLTLLFGLVGGLACGILVSWSTTNREIMEKDRAKRSTIEQSNYIDDMIAGMVLVGIFLGWQSAFSVTILMIAINALTTVFVGHHTSSGLNLSSRLMLVTLIHLLVWRLSTWIVYWPSPSASNFVMAATIGILVIAAIVFRNTTSKMRLVN